MSPFKTAIPILIEALLSLPNQYLALAESCVVTVPNHVAQDIFIFGGKTTAPGHGQHEVSKASWSFHWHDQLWRHEPDLIYAR